MAKPEWGAKHLCRSCGARFYDLRRKPIVCPKCGTVHVPEPANKPRRSPAPEPRPAAEERPAKPDVAEAAAAPDAEQEEKTEGDDIIEDPSELGEDEDDMAEVIDSSRDDDREG